MKLEQPVVVRVQCDRCGKKTRNFVEVQNAANDGAGMLAGHHGYQDVCNVCWRVIEAAVARAGKPMPRKRKAKEAV